MQPRLPQETLDHILSFLRDDHSSLQSCERVDQVFADMVKRHMYHRITLPNHVPRRNLLDWKTERLAKLFTENPHLRSYVRVLHILIASREGLKWFINPLTKEERIGEILPMFPVITTIVLSGKISWNKLHHSFRESFVQMLMQTPSVVNISISGIEDFPLPLLNHSKHLKRLTLIELKDSLSNVSEPLPNNERAQLVSLDIETDYEDHPYCFPPIFTWLQSPNSPQIQCLSSLRIDIPLQNDIPQLQALLDDRAITLQEVSFRTHESMEITFNTACEPVLPPRGVHHQVPNLSRLCSLRCLSISGNIKLTCTKDRRDNTLYILYTYIPWLVQLLQTFKTPSNVERIVLQATFSIDRKMPFIKLDWQPLVEILTSGTFPSLRKVEMHIKHFRASPFDFPHLISMLHGDDHLSSLEKSGLLSIVSHLPAKSPY